VFLADYHIGYNTDCMREFQAKKRIRKAIYSKITLFIILVFIVIIGRAAVSVFFKEQESFNNTVQAKKELTKLEDRQQLLNTEITRLSTEEGIEAEIRTKYNVAKYGEQFLVIVDTPETATTSKVVEKTWWEKFTGFFYK